MQRIPVSWDADAGAPTAPDVAICTGNGAVVIRWEGDASMGSITEITGLPAGPNDEFTAPRSTGTKMWTCTSRASGEGSWPYSISGTPASGGAGGSHDPVITNVPGEPSGL